MKPTAGNARAAWGTLPLCALLAACGGAGSGQAPVNSASSLPPPAPAPADPAPPLLDTPEYRRSSAAVASGALAAWTLGWSGAGVTVGVVDSGIADASPEFAGRISPASRDVTGQGRPITDPSGHGTAVAAVIGAARDNSQIVGIAPGVTIAAMRADSPGSCGGEGCRYTDSAIAAGIDAAVAAGARAVNISLGGGGASFTLRNAIVRATLAGVVIVVSAGNDGAAQVDGLASSFLAAGDPRLVIIAGGLAEAGGIAGFSNRAGAAQDNYVLALAERVRSFNHEGTPFFYSGTSFATPQVTAAVALMAQAFPNLSGAQIVELILSSAADLGAPGADPVHGRGRLDLARAFAPKGATALAGTSLAVSLNANGNLGAAMGSGQQFGAALGTVPIVDGYGREYQLAIGRTLRPAPIGRLLPALLAPPAHRDSRNFEAAGLSFTFGFAATAMPGTGALAQAADEAPLGLAHRGMDRNAGSRTPVRESHVAIRGGAVSLLAATGASPAAALPGSAPAGLLAPDGLEPAAGDMRSQRLLLAEARIGALQLAAASASGSGALALSPGLAHRYGTHRATLAASLPLPVPLPLTLSARWTRLAEQGAFLGTRLSPAFGLYGGAADLAGLALDLAPAPGWQLRAAATRGWHRPETGGGILAGAAGIESTGWSLRLAGPAPVGRWSVALAQPLALSAGAFLAGADRRPLPVAVDAAERIAELGWSHAGLALTAFHRANPGHRPGPADIGAAVRLHARF